MVLGKEEPRHAERSGLKQALAVGLDEAMTALEEAFYDLTEEQFWAFPLERRHNIVTLVEHCLQCLDLYGCEVHGRPLTFEPEERFDIWHFSPEQLRPQMTELPTVAAERERLAAVRAAVMETLEQATPEDLARPNPDSWWFEEYPRRVRADAYLRATFHTMAHVRQIWMLRGAMGLTDQDGWPVQHWA
jgi:hypothetical protein